SWGKIKFNLTFDKAIQVSDFFADKLQPINFQNDSVVYIGLDSGWDKMTDKQLKKFVDHCKSNHFTDLAVDLGWEYTLFDAKWERTNKDYATLDYTISKGIEPLVWSFSGIYYDANKRQEILKEFKSMGVKGVKIDFW